MGDLTLGHFLFLITGIVCYFAPMLVALSRQHKNTAPIIIVNFFLGWTGIGWVCALAWALTSSDNIQRDAK
jgi:hypothetical protein